MNHNKLKEEEMRLFDEFPPLSTEQWEEIIHKDLKGADYNKKLIWNTIEGFDVKPYYRREDIEDMPQRNSLPGEFPFVRGNNKSHNNWEIRQDIPESDPLKANEKALRAINRGANSVGLNVKDVLSVSDLKILLRGIDMGKTLIHFNSSLSYSIFFNILKEYLAANGINKEKVKGSFDFDFYAYYLLHGEYYNSLSDNINELACLIDLMKRELPGFDVLNVNASIYHNSGANVVQEVAFSLAEIIEYLSVLTDKGIAASDVLSRLRVSMALGNNYFFEIAKIRAARMLYAHIVRQYISDNQELHKLFIHTETSLWNKTVYDPHVNLLRATTEVMSGAIAGADSINVLPFDVAYSQGDEFSNRIARNIQIVLKEESYLNKIVDPSAGSYYIESLTSEIASHSWNLILKIEEMGGFTKALENGFIKDEISKTASKRNMDIAMRRTSILGTNQYPNLSEKMLEKIQRLPKWPNHYLKVYRGAEVFENLRMKTEEYIAEGKKQPLVFLLTIGNLTMRKARASFATNFFGCAGYRINDNAGFKTIDEGINAAIKEDADIVVLCSSDEEYDSFGVEAARLLKRISPSTSLFIAGNPTEIKEKLTDAGVDDFVHMRTNVVDFLGNCHKAFSII